MRVRVLRVLDVGGLPRVFWWVWVSTLVARTGAFVAPFLSYYLTRSLGHSAAFAGFVAALNAGGAAVSAVVGGVLADRVGRRGTLLGALVASAVTLVALGSVHSVGLIAVLAFLAGLANNATRPATGAIIADIVPSGDRGRAYALNYWAINLGFAVAMLSAGAVASHGYSLLFMGDAIANVGCAVVVFFTVPETRPTSVGVAGAGHAGQPERAGTLVDVLRDRIFLGFLGAVLVGAVIYSQAQTVQPIMMGQDGLGPGAYGAVAALNGILIGVLQLPMTSWMRRYTHGSVLAASSFLMGAGFAVPLLISAVGHPMGVYAGSVVVWTIAEIGSTPPQMALGADLAPAHLRGRYQGMSTLAWSVAGIVGPLVGGWALTAIGASAVLWASLLLGAAGVPAWVMLDRRSRTRVATLRAAEAHWEPVLSAIASPEVVSAGVPTSEPEPEPV
ncbi:major facilitator superfamily MFS_1 [Catenulispora acidiphila DSM 44928]|uniref:Major facilitator superfamily MFS_1 n=1 Tax=Catenulispora acidiphila (strain DSM 44928 / JCM 14897 / NBRC 102108 / NRRL B-24433 / ID139908) TaxID=479433 RepID=C7QHW7_CATAD|nr:major facilitator superfamily MFS_1 [Catenulispora acidiphila DSM 44928]